MSKESKKRMYFASKTITVVFQSELSPDEPYGLQKEAEKYIKEESKNIDPDTVPCLKEVNSFLEVPVKWRHVLFYGANEDITCAEYFAKSDKDYQEYLKIKEVYEPEE